MAEKKRRVLLKLSGEAFGDGQLGINPDVVAQIAREIAEGAKKAEVAIVVGGGNFFRGAELSQRGMDRRRAVYMGMLGTVMNALALQDFLEQAGGCDAVSLKGFAVGAGEFAQLGKVADGNVFYRAALVEAGADFDEIGLGVGIGERPEARRG